MRIRRSKLRPGSDQMTPEWRATVLSEPCVYCVLGEATGEPNQLEHIHPRSQGGKNGWPNIAPACKSHNTMKANFSMLWMLWRLNERRHGRCYERPIRMRGRVVLETMTVYTNHAPWRRKQAVAKDGRGLLLSEQATCPAPETHTRIDHPDPSFGEA